MMIKLVREQEDIRRLILKWQQEGLQVALVPTMGGIHDGHLALMRQAAKQADKVVVSIYVNPTQFAAGEDFDSYPRALEDDLAQIAGLGTVQAVFAPASLYHSDHATTLLPAGAAAGLEADARPHFFQGVATVVLKLFMMMPADIAIFGEKDYQQLAVIRQMVRDLNIPIQIESAPTIRSDNGLALSSRNRYLSEKEAEIAPRLYQCLGNMAADIKAGQPVEETIDKAEKQLLADGFDKVDYLRLVDAHSLTPLKQHQGAGRLLAAVWLGQTRLIDNIAC